MRYVTSLVLSLPLIGVYAIFAIGIVLIYRASRVLNLAHGAMAMVPAYILRSLSEAGIPLPVAFPLSLAAGALLGLGVERVFVRRLRAQGPTAQTVGTVAALGILISVAAKVWGTTALEAVRIFPKGALPVGVSSIQYGELGLFAIMIVVAGALFALLQRTDLGLMMRGAAESRLAAALHGVNPDRITELTWALGGGLAALAGILLAGVTTLDPYKLSLQALPGFIAALIGGMGSLPGALAGAVVVGVTQGLVPVLGALGNAQGAPQLFLALVAITVMATRGQSLVASDVREIGAGHQPANRTADSEPEESEEIQTGLDPAPWRRSLRKNALQLVLVVAIIVFPYVVPYSLVGSANLGAPYALAGIALVLLTGWVGQISLGHAALVGVGAYATGWFAGGLGIPFPLSLPLAAATAGGVAALLGLVALRVRGLYLAVATLVFSWMASEFLFRQTWFTKHDQIPARIIGERYATPSFDFTDRRVFFVVAWAVVVASVYLVANVRDSKTGRAFFAVRGSEVAAASLGIDVMRTKLVAFATSGALAGAAGNLLMSNARVVTADQFTFNVSLFFLSIAVVGGMSSMGGAVASGLLFAGLTELFFRVRALSGLLEVVSSGLLAATLLAYRGGLSSIPRRVAALGSRLGIATPLPVRERSSRLGTHIAAHERPQSEPGFQPEGNGHARTSLAQASLAQALVQEAGPPVVREELPALIEATGVRVQFGGLVAVDDASLTVRRGEIVGLIGPNGAGKTTLFNAIAGFNSPAAGTIALYGRDVTAEPVHRRASIGVARTFQAIQLFGELSVFENLLVATHVHNQSGYLQHVLVGKRSLSAEQEARGRVVEVLRLLDLSGIAGRSVGGLPFGVLRMVEVARALVTGFKVMMLDEPASGLDNTETDRLMDVLRFVKTLGVTQLLIEHDVRMVTSVSDYIYVLDQGSIIAEGTPDAIQRNPAVVAAYLGQPAGRDEKAGAR